MHKPQPLRLLVVGGGAAGVAVAWNILRCAERPVELVIADPREAIGLGVAYATSRDDYVLNVPAGRMGLAHDDPNHFVDWAGSGADDFISRRKYGRYLQESLDQEIRNSKFVDFRHVRTEVTSIDLGQLELMATTSDGPLGTFDKAVLAVGLGSLYQPEFTKTIGGAAGYVPDVWAPGLDYASGVIACIGTGLTFVDHALAALRDDPNRKVLGFSRTGWVPESHLPKREPAWEVPPAARKTAVGLVEFIDSAGSAWRAAQDGVRHDLPEIWRDLPESEKNEFLQSHWRWWNVRRHRAAPEISIELRNQLESGRLEVIAGEINDIKAKTSGFRIKLSDSRTFDVDQVLNCTGQDLDVVTPLISRLLDEGVVSRGPLGLGLAADFDSYRLRRGDGTLNSNLFAIGKILLGERLETTAMPEIRIQAAEIARQLLVG